MDLNRTRFQYRLYEGYSVQAVLGALVKNFGMAAVLHSLAEVSIPNNAIQADVCPICFDNGVGSEKWGGHHPSCPKSHAA